MGLVWRLVLLALIPLRMFLELFWCYIWTPRDKKTRTIHPANKATNGHSSTFPTSNGHDHDGEVDTKAVSPDKLKDLYDALELWWGPTSSLQVMSRMNKVRMPIIVQTYIKDVQGRQFDPAVLKEPTPLLGARICDVGCGGGYLTEALVDAGAEVVAIDASEATLLAAKQHWTETRGSKVPGPEYHHALVQDFSQRHEGEFDIVVCSELIGNVMDSMSLLPHIMKLVKEGGAVVITTNSRTLSSLLFTIIWLEHVAAVVPFNFRHLYKFIRPQELHREMRKYNVEPIETIGFLPLGLTARLTWRLQWVLTSFTGLWYAQVAKKVFA